MMKHETRSEDGMRQGMYGLFLAVALCVSIGAETPNRVNGLQASAIDSQERLELGKPIERQIAEGETHSFTLTLEAGEFVHVFVYQRSVNVAATLFGPDGKKLLEADSPVSTQEAEWITHIARPAGEYKIEVHAVDKGAPAGGYEVNVEEQRRSVPGDAARV